MEHSFTGFVLKLADTTGYAAAKKLLIKFVVLAPS